MLQGRLARGMRGDERRGGGGVAGAAELTVEGAVRVMWAGWIVHLPVAGGGGVVVVLSIGDLVKWTISLHEETIAHLTSYISGGYGGVG